MTTTLNDLAHLRLQPIRRVTLAESIYENLLEAIVSGKLAGGTVVSEVQLAEKYRVSRTPVREALHLLARDGLVRNAVNRRATVTDFSHKDIREIYELREGLESIAAALAAERLPDDAIDGLTRLVDALGVAGEDEFLQKALTVDDTLHGTIAEGTGNARLRRELVRCGHPIRILRRIAGRNPTHLRQAHDEHVEVVRALGSRDARAAREAMGRHIRSAVTLLIADLDRQATADREPSPGEPT